MLGREGRHAVRDALDRLPHAERVAVAARYLVGLTDAETAAALGMPRATVKMRAWRGLKQLRSELGEEGIVIEQPPARDRGRLLSGDTGRWLSAVVALLPATPPTRRAVAAAAPRARRRVRRPRSSCGTAVAASCARRRSRCPDPAGRGACPSSAYVTPPRSANETTIERSARASFRFEVVLPEGDRRARHASSSTATSRASRFVTAVYGDERTGADDPHAVARELRPLRQAPDTSPRAPSSWTSTAPTGIWIEGGDHAVFYLGRSGVEGRVAWRLRHRQRARLAARLRLVPARDREPRASERSSSAGSLRPAE